MIFSTPLALEVLDKQACALDMKDIFRASAISCKDFFIKIQLMHSL